MKYLHDVGPRAKRLGLASLSVNQFQAIISDDEDVGSLAILRTNVSRLVHEQGNVVEFPALEGMMQLATSPYFGRGWIQQEIALPKHLVFRWGGREIDSSLFEAALQLYRVWVFRSLSMMLTPFNFGVPHMRTLMERVNASSSKMGPTFASLALRNMYRSPIGRGTLTTARAIHRLSSVQFSQPQDRVYGILGIISDNTTLGLRVNTQLPWEEIFTDAAKRIIHLDQSLTTTWGGMNFLSLVQFPKSSAALPSWVPDLTRLNNSATLGSATTSLTPGFEACGDLRHTPDRFNFLEPSALRCRGAIVDRISSIGSLWERDPAGQDVLHAGLQPLRELASYSSLSSQLVGANPFSNHPFRNNLPRLSEAAWRVPILDREPVDRSTSTCRRATPRSKEGYDKVMWTTKFSRLSSDVFKLLTDLPLTDDERRDLDARGLGWEDRQLAELQFKMDKNSTYQLSVEHSNYCTLMDGFKIRRPFHTIEGFVGIGPVGMKVGDIVCVLAGADFPFILRETGTGDYELVGEAFCDGIMNGETSEIGLEIVDSRLR